MRRWKNIIGICMSRTNNIRSCNSKVSRWIYNAEYISMAKIINTGALYNVVARTVYSIEFLMAKIIWRIPYIKYPVYAFKTACLRWWRWWRRCAFRDLAITFACFVKFRQVDVFERTRICKKNFTSSKACVEGEKRNLDFWRTSSSKLFSRIWGE